MKDLRRPNDVDMHHRLRYDYCKTRHEVLEELRNYLPDIDEDKLTRLIDDEAMDYRNFDGIKYYFRASVKNFFRRSIQYKCVAIDNNLIPSCQREQFMRDYIPRCLRLAEVKHIQFDFTLSLKTDVVSPGEVIRCWLPIPRRDLPFQNVLQIDYNITPQYVVESNAPHSYAYFETIVEQGRETNFSYSCRLAMSPQLLCRMSNNSNNGMYNKALLDDYLCETAPHIVFTDELKGLAASIVQPHDTPFVKAKKLFHWFSDNIPWTSSHEYSTTPNIPMWVLKWRSGDCGEKSLLYITLCRICGIPARWQSGFMLHPGFDNLHDWVEIYVQELGWVPVDVSFGVQKFLTSEEEMNFFLGNRDAYHLVVNSDFSEHFKPRKQFVRSETVDFQRGEIETSKKNLYFDQWNWHFEVKYLDS